jgi:hypothetical protein
MSDYTDLYGDERIVNTVRTPNFHELSIQQAMNSWQKMRSAYQGWLNNLTDNQFGDRYGDERFDLDEIALLFEDRDVKWEWIEFAVRNPDVKLFNSADDRVHTDPIPSDYNVEYAFLEVRDAGFRVEAMNIGAGVSPLHQAYLQKFWSGEAFQPLVIHVSFKVPEDDYAAVCEAMDDSGAIFTQGCESAYGKFSYWKVPELWETSACVYLKPRCNVRDAVAPTPPPTVPENAGAGHPTLGGSVRRLFGGNDG